MKLKCRKCGAELKKGRLYCSKCGKAVQIVPDYNLLDDVLYDTLAKKKNRRSAGKKKPEGKKAGHVKKAASKSAGNPKQKSGLKIFAGVSCLCVVVFIAVLFVIHANSYETQYEKGLQAMRLGDYETALDFFYKCMEKEPQDTELCLNVAQCSYEAGRTDDALDYLELVLKNDRQNEQAYALLIKIYEEKKQYDKIVALRENVSEELKEKLFADYVVAAPKFSIPEGEYNEDVTLELFSEGDAEIYYTLDGTSPIEDGILYEEEDGILLEEGETEVLAVCMDERGIYSETVAAQYEISYSEPNMPVVSPDGGQFMEPQMITVHVPDGCAAYYTWDRSVPTQYSTQYTEPIEIPLGNNVLSVILIDEHGLTSAVYRGNFVYMP